MIVRKMENPVFHRRKRASLPGYEFAQQAVNHEKSFDQYLIDAFQGEVVQQGEQFSNSLSNLAQDNLIRLGQV